MGEFKTAVFRTKDQWAKGGISFLLEKTEGGGIMLPYQPGYERMILSGLNKPSVLSIDECGRLYFMDVSCRFFRYDTGHEEPKIIPYIGGCGSDPGRFDGPKRILFQKTNIWILDRHRVQVFSKGTWQLKKVMVFEQEDPIDITADVNGFIYLLIRYKNKIFKIQKYDRDGLGIDSDFNNLQLKDPISIHAGGDIFVFDRRCMGSQRTCYLRFSDVGEFIEQVYLGEVPSGKSYREPEASMIEMNPKDDIFVLEKNGTIQEFAIDGSFSGTISGHKHVFKGLAFDAASNMYAGTTEGIAFFSAAGSYTKEKGYYYTRGQDSGIEGCQWHRLSIDAEMPAESIIEISYYSSNDRKKKEKMDEIMDDPALSIQAKREKIENEIQNWSVPPETFSFPAKQGEIAKSNTGIKSSDMLFRQKTGRYIWLKISLQTFNEKSGPSVSALKLVYPRTSYLRYLPVIYQEDATSRDFLERFLSLFETVFHELESKIEDISRYFDPEVTPKGFLTWLSSWINFALEDEWDEEMKRRFIAQAFFLYRKKGTVKGIEDFIEIYTGKRPSIIEYSRIGKPLVLREPGMFNLGINSLLLRTPVRGFRLGEDSILGRVALREIDPVRSYSEPFIPLLGRFSVVIDLPEDDLDQTITGLKRILDDIKPAHTSYDIRGGTAMRPGLAYAGINTGISDHLPITLGDTAVGRGIVVMVKEDMGRAHSRLIKDTDLV